MLSRPNLFTRIVKNGCIHNGKQRFKCLECGRQVEPPTKVIDLATKELIDRLLLKRLSLAGMARAVKMAKTLLQHT